MKKILTIIGTRPEAIKMAPLCHGLSNEPWVEHKLCLTGQHREMLDQVVTLFDLHADYNLKIMKGSQTLSQVAASILTSLTPVLEDYQPDLVLVHGDTSTCVIAALSAFYLHIPVMHVEAGLRTKDILAPWPEEANRRLVSVITQHHFAPTKLAQNNLLKEGVDTKNITVTGNTVVDALYYIHSKITNNHIVESDILKDFAKIDFKKHIILVTCHRRENFGEGVLNVCRALRKLSNLYPDFQIVYPVHLNPKIQEPVNELLGGQKNILLFPPLEYMHFVYLMSKAYFILTDSGGIQEEAPALGKPVLVMRDTTERHEAVNAGTVKLVGTSAETIVDECCQLINDESQYKSMARAHNPYGDGRASEQIIKKIRQIVC